jgi:hypothetical protein
MVVKKLQEPCKNLSRAEPCGMPLQAWSCKEGLQGGALRKKILLLAKGGKPQLRVTYNKR